MTTKDTVESLLPGIIDFRHQLHQIPELAGEELKTSQAIRRRLESVPHLTVLPPFLKTDVVAMLNGRKPGQNITLRADIDALRITEETGVPYASTHPGLMHACGHDGHAAMLMGAAEYLAQHTDDFDGSIRFVWQPGEEGLAMSRFLLDAGALENPKADLVTALHGMPGMPLGSLAIRNGAMMAANAHFTVTINGKGGHSSRPHEVHNPVLAACATVSALENMVPNRINPQSGTVMAICQIQGGNQDNVIPDTVSFSGTLRTLDQAVADGCQQEMQAIIDGTCMAYGVKGVLDWRPIYPVTVNDNAVAQLSRQAMRGAVGPENVIELESSSMAAEDFAYYLQRYPGTYVKVGTGVDMPPLHSSRYDFPDAALTAGIRYFINFAVMNLQES